MATKSKDVSRGWRRWVRARDAAFSRPTTEHAKLYVQRVLNAQDLDKDHVNLRYTTRNDYDWRTKQTAKRVDYYVCSDFCAEMQRQLTPYDSFHPRYPAELTRAVKCHVCARVVHKDSSTNNTERVVFDIPDETVRLLKPERHVIAPTPAPNVPVWHYIGTALPAPTEVKPSRSKYWLADNGTLFEGEPEIRVANLTDEEAELVRLVAPTLRKHALDLLENIG